MYKFVPLLGHPKYKINKMGQVKHIITKKIRKKNKNAYGYYAITFKDNGRFEFHPIHRLLALTFIPNPNNLPQVNHINGIKTDNRLENLEWCTHANNIRHAHKLGLISHKGEKHSKVKLSNRKVKQIREQLSKGIKGTDLAKRYHVKPSTIYAIRDRVNWSHI